MSRIPGFLLALLLVGLPAFTVDDTEVPIEFESLTDPRSRR